MQASKPPPQVPTMLKNKMFRDYSIEERKNYITLSSGEFYPDILPEACELYKPVLVTFESLMKRAASSTLLFEYISEEGDQNMRTQLCRVFRKYVSPSTPVELLKKKSMCKEICQDFGSHFRPIQEVQAKFATRPIPDEALCALLWEYKDRGKKGYDLTEQFFHIIEHNYPGVVICGPRRAGKDVQPRDFWPDYPNENRPLDFVITSKNGKQIYAVGLARYDGDRGGAQEDDRPGGYDSCASELQSYIVRHKLKTKILFVNDGPGLLLGTMWNDYSRIEEKYAGLLMVMTLRMIPERLTTRWLKGE